MKLLPITASCSLGDTRSIQGKKQCDRDTGTENHPLGHDKDRLLKPKAVAPCRMTQSNQGDRRCCYFVEYGSENMRILNIGYFSSQGIRYDMSSIMTYSGN